MVAESESKPVAALARQVDTDVGAALSEASAWCWGGGRLGDGFWSWGGLHEDGEGVSRTFPDIEELVVACRFTDCSHETEPGCAVQEAIGDGRLEERRWHSWRKLQREAEWIATRSDPVARAAARKRWAATGRAGRARAALKRGQDPFA